ncbi:MAG: YSC84-related protein [Planctomycetota bacterium]|nr:YSC84-related protein [Planctomycetota bacterium]
MKTLILCLGTMIAMLLSACSTAPTTASDRQELNNDSQNALADFKATDPSLGQFLDSAYGYATFPDIGKGAVVVGGAYGHGQVYEHGKLVGYADITQATVGAALGGQEYSELLVFQNQQAMDNFKAGSFTFAAQASAVAANSGAASSAKFENGVAVFVKTKGGLMGEASVGGQKFNFTSAAPMN